MPCNGWMDGGTSCSFLLKVSVFVEENVTEYGTVTVRLAVVCIEGSIPTHLIRLDKFFFVGLIVRLFGDFPLTD